MRAFVAIDLPDDLRETLAALQSDLPVGRPVPEENLHLTLAFLDEQDETALAALHEALQGLDAAPFELSPRGLGVFGGNRPRLLYAGIAPCAALTRLHGRVTGAARRAGIALRHERYVPHVTLARFGTGARGSDLHALQQFLAAHIAFEGPPMPVRGFGLFASHLRPRGALHEKLAHYPLAAADPSAAD